MAKSKADSERLAQLHNMSCICCELLGKPQPLPTEAHHLRGKKHHQETISLCGWHHRADIRPGDSKIEMLFEFGPSIEYQGSKGAFARRWGTMEKLLAMINERLKSSHQA